LFRAFDLNKRLLTTLDNLGFSQPTPVQEATIPVALEGHDLMVSAETGSGKTAAYLLPTLHRLISEFQPGQPKQEDPRALILSPTRELARQIDNSIQQLTGKTQLLSVLLTGGDDFKFQQSLLRKNPDIVVATPGRLLEHMERGLPDLSQLDILVIDEADRMLDMGMGGDVIRIAEGCSPDRQTLLFSATLSPKGLKGICDQILRDPKQLLLNTAQDANQNITQQMILADDPTHKEKLLQALLESHSYRKALVFTNTREQATHLNAILNRQRKSSALLHGEMRQDERNETLEGYRNHVFRVVVATDLAARGLDIPEIDLVINYDMARSGDDYVHRIGRTGRAGESGTAISFITANEWNVKAGIERYLRVALTPIVVDGLEAKYKGPKKVKASGKAAGTKKKKKKNLTGLDKRKAGPTKKPTKKPLNKKTSTPIANADGMAPPKRRKKPE
jgi:superfamily II DNA/RNA helicase